MAQVILAGVCVERDLRKSCFGVVKMLFCPSEMFEMLCLIASDTSWYINHNKRCVCICVCIRVCCA